MGETGERTGDPGSERIECAVRRVCALAGETARPDWPARVGALDPSAPLDYAALALLLVRAWRSAGVRRAGISGGQGTGKSTLARLIAAAGEQEGLRILVLALDDYYLPRAQRLALARRVHPLFETRGPPGTHDVALCREHLAALAGSAPIELPVFDKGRDDRVGTRRVAGPFDLVLLEGWCVGAEPAGAAALALPSNALERVEDPTGIWRRHQDGELAGGYAALWSDLERLVFLRAPDLDAVRRWRLEQEAERPAHQRLDAAGVARFVAHYERITARLIADPPPRADWRVALAADHSIAAITRRSPGGR
ncbi:MAG: kinase [Myxococcota bacterium]